MEGRGGRRTRGRQARGRREGWDIVWVKGEGLTSGWEGGVGTRQDGHGQVGDVCGLCGGGVGSRVQQCEGWGRGGGVE